MHLENIWFRSRACFALFLLGVAAVAPSGALANPNLDRLTGLFLQSYRPGIYEEGRCGQNVMRFVRLAHERGIDLSQVYIVHITNAGGTELDPVMGFSTKGRGGSSRWMFHAVFEFQGMVFDFDFAHPGPSNVVPRAFYLKKMFFTPRSPRDLPWETFLDSARRDYRFKRIPALNYIHYVRTGVSLGEADIPKLTIEEYLRSR